MDALPKNRHPRRELTDKELLHKYKAGRIPSLSNTANPTDGLIDPDLLDVIYHGYLNRHNISVGFLLANTEVVDHSRRWELGDFGPNNSFSRRYWGSYCAELRAHPVGNKLCEDCDRRHAAQAEAAGKTIAYLCDNGLIDFATPIQAAGKTIAVIFSGQHRPVEDRVWNPAMLWPHGSFQLLSADEIGVDAWEHSQKRIRSAEDRLGMDAGSLLDCLQTDPGMDPERVVEVQTIMDFVRDQLQDQAENTMALEKNRILAWLRAEIAGSLSRLPKDHPDTGPVWEELAKALEWMAIYFGCDYIAVLACANGEQHRMLLKCQTGLPADLFPLGAAFEIPSGVYARFKAEICGRDKQGPVSLAFKSFRGSRLFDWLHEQHARKHSGKALVFPLQAPLEPPNSSPPLLLMGRFERDLPREAEIHGDREALRTLAADISDLAETLALVDQLQERNRLQIQFLRDVAHDIRSPIQSILGYSTLLARNLSAADRVAYHAGKIHAQMVSLEQMSRRIWMVAEDVLHRGAPLDVGRVSLYTLLNGCRRDLQNSADKRGIKVWVDPELDKWRAIVTDRSLLQAAIYNLLDNAIKYSCKDSEVRVDGRQSADGYTLNFVNRGIPIRAQDQERIFDLYFRTPEAQRHRPEGTGIGLHLVKRYADQYGGIQAWSSPIKGSSDFVTTFALFIRERSY